MASAAHIMRARQAVPSSFALRWSWWATVPLALAAVACAVPWLLMRLPEWGFALQRGFALVCHQQPDRSFNLFGGAVAVCTRCLGIYLGAAAGSLVGVLPRAAWRWLIVAVAINILDWLAESSGMHGNWAFTRFVLGIALGAGAAMLVRASAEQFGIPTQVNET